MSAPMCYWCRRRAAVQLHAPGWAPTGPPIYCSLACSLAAAVELVTDQLLLSWCVGCRSWRHANHSRPQCLRNNSPAGLRPVERRGDEPG